MIRSAKLYFCNPDEKNSRLTGSSAADGLNDELEQVQAYNNIISQPNVRNIVSSCSEDVYILHQDMLTKASCLQSANTTGRQYVEKTSMLGTW